MTTENSALSRNDLQVNCRGAIASAYMRGQQFTATVVAPSLEADLLFAVPL